MAPTPVRTDVRIWRLEGGIWCKDLKVSVNLVASNPLVNTQSQCSDLGNVGSSVDSCGQDSQHS
jgi:hypothetical protein